jgi:hypothetical protein
VPRVGVKPGDRGEAATEPPNQGSTSTRGRHGRARPRHKGRHWGLVPLATCSFQRRTDYFLLLPFLPFLPPLSLKSNQIQQPSPEDQPGTPPLRARSTLRRWFPTYLHSTTPRPGGRAPAADVDSAVRSPFLPPAPTNFQCRSSLCRVPALCEFPGGRLGCSALGIPLGVECVTSEVGFGLQKPCHPAGVSVLADKRQGNAVLLF